MAVAVGVGVGGMGVGVGVGVLLGAGVGVGVGVAVAVAVGVGVEGMGVGLGAGVLVGVAVGAGVALAIAVGLGVGVSAAGTGVRVGATVGAGVSATRAVSGLGGAGSESSRHANSSIDAARHDSPANAPNRSAPRSSERFSTMRLASTEVTVERRPVSCHSDILSLPYPYPNSPVHRQDRSSHSPSTSSSHTSSVFEALAWLPDV